MCISPLASLQNQCGWEEGSYLLKSVILLFRERYIASIHHSNTNHYAAANHDPDTRSVFFSMLISTKRCFRCNHTKLICLKRDEICLRKKNIGCIRDLRSLKEVADHHLSFSYVEQATMIIIIFHRIITIVLFGSFGYLPSAFAKHFLTYQLNCTPK